MTTNLPLKSILVYLKLLELLIQILFTTSEKRISLLIADCKKQCRRTHVSHWTSNWSQSSPFCEMYRNVEIRQMCMPSLIQQDVVWFDIPIHPNDKQQVNLFRSYSLEWVSKKDGWDFWKVFFLTGERFPIYVNPLKPMPFQLRKTSLILLSYSPTYPNETSNLLPTSSREPWTNSHRLETRISCCKRKVNQSLLVTFSLE